MDALNLFYNVMMLSGAIKLKAVQQPAAAREVFTLLFQKQTAHMDPVKEEYITVSRY